MTLRRRDLFPSALALAALAGLPRWSWAATEPLVLAWEDLMPPAQAKAGAVPPGMRGIVNHGELGQSLPADAATPTQLRHDYDGRLIKLPGYALPLSFEEVGVTEFLLVPYMGACVHVPPPPANQIVLVTTAEPIVFTELFAAVWVTGTLKADISTIEVIDIGYKLAATDISDYRLEQ